MTDGQSLLLLFAALYLIECLRWLPARSHLLVGSGAHWKVTRPFQPIELAGGNPALLSFLPPLQAHLPTLPWLLIPAEEGLELNLDERNPQVLPWAALTPKVDGRTLHLSPHHRVRCLNENHAHQLMAQVTAWLPMSPADREADFLNHARQTLQAGPFQASAEGLSAKTRPLRHLGSALFLWAFAVIVTLYRWLGEGVVILSAAGVLFALQFIQAFLWHRRSQGVPYRYWKALAVALLPQHAMRAADHLCDLPVASPAHPLAARALIGDQAWKNLATQFWKKACYQPSATGPLQSRALQAFFEEQKLAVTELETVPVQEPGSTAYCPNCQTQFQSGATLCKDCGGVPLRSFNNESRN